MLRKSFVSLFLTISAGIVVGLALGFVLKTVLSNLGVEWFLFVFVVWLLALASLVRALKS